MKGFYKFLFCLLAGYFALCITLSAQKSKRFVFFGYCTPDVVIKTDTIKVKVPADTLAILNKYKYLFTPDTASILAKYCKQIPSDTSLILSMYCDTIAPNDPIDTDTLFRGIYLNGFYNIVGNKPYEDALIYDLNRWKFNCTYAYDLGDVLADKSPALAKLNKRMRAEVPLKEIGAARGNSSSCIGAATTFNKANSDSSDFDTWNLEFEPWNAYPKATSPFWTIDKKEASSTTSTEASRGLAWQQNKVYLNEMNAGKVAGQVENVVDYFGWFKTPFQLDAPKVLINQTDYLIVHMYYSSPDFSRSKDRCNELDKLGVKAIFRPIFSAEPDFMQDYYRTHSIDEAYFVWHAGFKAQNYKNLTSDGYVVFALDFLRVAQPGTAPLARMAESDTTEYLPAFVDPDFQNKTTERSKALAEEN